MTKQWRCPEHMQRSEVQLELDTVIDYAAGACWPKRMYDISCGQEDAHKPAGIRLAKMLGQYEANPSSELWSSIQSFAREILK